MPIMGEQEQKDFLTGFFMRGSLTPFLDKTLAEHKASGKGFSVVLIDLDRFKKYNDKYGHSFGDEILKYATSTMRMTFFEGPCFLFRYGGDEFVAVFPDKDPREAMRLVHKCTYNLIRRPFLYRNKFYKLTLSCGIAGFPHDGSTGEDLVRKADQAMYFSKRHGRGRATIASLVAWLRFRNAALFILSTAVIVYSSLVLYQLRLKSFIQPRVSQFQHLRLIAKPETTNDAVVLKSGAVVEGRIVSAIGDTVVIRLSLDKGEGETVFKKNEIAEIRYGSKQ